MNEHERFMRYALQAAEMGRGQTSPNPLVGAVIVKDGQIVGQGAHLKAGGPHAEVHALRMAGAEASGATVYVTLEPCNHTGRTPPCTEALIAAGVRRVVVAAGDPNPLVNGTGIRRLRESGIEVIEGILSLEAEAQNEAYVTWVRQKRPFVVWKCATTLDGCIAATSGHSQYVTGEAARTAAQELRQQFPAIGVGIGTVLADNPRLTVRMAGSAAGRTQPLRVVFDSRFRFPGDARMLAESGATLIYTTARGMADRRGRRGMPKAQPSLEAVVVGEDAEGRVDLVAALQDLGRRGVNGILIEGGGTLASALLRRRLVDKVVYFMAPKLLGGGISVLAPHDTKSMAEAISLRHTTWSTVGEDLCLVGYPVY